MVEFFISIETTQFLKDVVRGDAQGGSYLELRIGRHIENLSNLVAQSCLTINEVAFLASLEHTCSLTNRGSCLLGVLTSVLQKTETSLFILTKDFQNLALHKRA